MGKRKKEVDAGVGGADAVSEEVETLRESIADSAKRLASSFLVLHSASLYFFVANSMLSARDVLSDRAQAGTLAWPVIGVQTHVSFFLVLMSFGVLVLSVDYALQLDILRGSLERLAALRRPRTLDRADVPPWAPARALAWLTTRDAQRSPAATVVVALSVFLPVFGLSVGGMVYGWAAYSAYGGAPEWRATVLGITGLIVAVDVVASVRLASGSRPRRSIGERGPRAWVAAAALIVLLPTALAASAFSWRIVGLDFRGSDLSGLDLTRKHEGVLQDHGYDEDDITFEGAKMDHVNLSLANLAGLRFVGADLRDADLTLAVLDGARFEGADLRNADLRGAWLDGAALGGAQVHGADFRGASLERAVGSRLVGACAQPMDADAALLARACRLSIHARHDDPPAWLDARVRVRAAHLGEDTCNAVTSMGPCEASARR